MAIIPQYHAINKVVYFGTTNSVLWTVAIVGILNGDLVRFVGGVGGGRNIFQSLV